MRVRPQHKKLSVYGHILIYKCHKFTRAFPFLHKVSSWQSVMFKIQNERRRVHARRQTEHCREGDNRLFSAKISIVLKYLLLKVNLRFKSQPAVRIFYESRNFKGITACNCLNINKRRSITAFYRIKKWQQDVTVIKVNVFLQNITHLLINSEFVLLFVFIIFIIISIFRFKRFKLYSLYTMLNKFIKTNLCKVFNTLCKVCATAALN